MVELTGKAKLLPRMQRSDGAAELGFARRFGVTRLAHLYQHDPCRFLFPQVDPGELLTAVLVTTSGGLAGGDCVRVGLSAGAGTAALVTSQAAEKVYRSTGPDTLLDIQVRVEADAWLEWLPQETILFDGARLNRRTELNVAPGGRLLAGECAVFGRTAHGESFTRGLLHDAWRVRCGERLIWADALRVDGDATGLLQHPAGFAGAVAHATIVYVADDAPAWLDLARDCLDGSGSRTGVSAVAGLLLVRLLGQNAQVLRRDIARFWAGFRHGVAGWPPQVPKLWYS